MNRNFLRGAAAFAIVALLQGGASPAIAGESHPKSRGWLGPDPVTTPSPGEIAGRENALGTAIGTNMKASEYTATGYLLINEACNQYFDLLIRDQNINGLASDITVSTGTAFGTILGLANASSGDLGRAAAGFGWLSSILKSFKDRALVTPYPTETKSLIMSALRAYERAAPASSVTTKEQAATLVEGYAEICSYSGVTRLAKEALAAGEPEADQEAATPSALPIAGQMLAQAAGVFLGVDGLTDEQLALLYLYAIKQPDLHNNAPKAQYVLAKLPQSLADKLGDEDGKYPLPADVLNPKAIDMLKEINAQSPNFGAMVAKVEEGLPVTPVPEEPVDDRGGDGRPTPPPPPPPPPSSDAEPQASPFVSSGTPMVRVKRR